MAVEHERQISEAKRLTSLLTATLGVAALLVWLFKLLSGVLNQTEGVTDVSAGYQVVLLVVGLGLLATGVLIQLPNLMVFFAQRKAFGMVNEGLKIGLALAAVCLVNWLAHRHNPRWDLTSDRLYTVSAEAKALAESITLETRFYLVTGPRAPQRINATREYLQAFASTNANFDLRPPVANAHTLPQDRVRELMETLDMELGVDLEGLTIQVGLTQEDNTWKTLRSKSIPWRRLWVGSGKAGGSAEFRGEEEIGSAFRELIDEEKPRIYVLTGHGERSPADFERNGYGLLGKVMREKNYQFDELRLSQEPNAKVPDDATLVLLLGPELSLEESEVEGLKRYLDRGGDAVFFLEPRVENRLNVPHYVASGLETYLASTYRIQVLNQSLFVALSQSEASIAIPATKFGDHEIVKDEDPRAGTVYVVGARPLKVLPPSGVCLAKELMTVEPLPKVPDWVFASAEPKLRAALADPGRQRGPFTLAAAATRNVELEPEVEGDAPLERTSRVVVVGDVDWGANSSLRDRRTRNFDVLLNTMSWAAQRDHEVVGERKRPRSYRLRMSESTRSFYALTSLFGLPLLSILLGVVVWRVRSQ